MADDITQDRTLELAETVARADAHADAPRVRAAARARHTHALRPHPARRNERLSNATFKDPWAISLRGYSGPLDHTTSPLSPHAPQKFRARPASAGARAFGRLQRDTFGPVSTAARPDTRRAGSARRGVRRMPSAQGVLRARAAESADELGESRSTFTRTQSLAAAELNASFPRAGQFRPNISNHPALTKACAEPRPFPRVPPPRARRALCLARHGLTPRGGAVRVRRRFNPNPSFFPFPRGRHGWSTRDAGLPHWWGQDHVPTSGF